MVNSVRRYRWRENRRSDVNRRWRRISSTFRNTRTRRATKLTEIDREKKKRGKEEIYEDSIGIRRSYLPHRCLRERRWPCRRTEVTETSSKSWVNRWCWASRWKCSRTWSPFQWRSICWRSWRTAPGISGFSRARKRSRKATTPPYKIEHRGRSPCSSRPPPWCWLKWKLCTRSSSLSGRSLRTNWSSPWKNSRDGLLSSLTLIFLCWFSAAERHKSLLDAYRNLTKDSGNLTTTDDG